MHLVDSLGRSKKRKSYCCHHEQACAIAAEGYARIKNDIGVCVVTTGPGGTNAITGAAGAWLDSIPLLVISGQVKRETMVPRKNGKPLYRALGFQELNIIDLVKPITKYAVTVEKEEDIRYHLEKAVYLAKSGRPGPVWVEIPLDVQGPIDKKTGEVDPRKLKRFIKPPSDQWRIPIKKIVEKLQKAKRPLLMAGNGIRLAGGEKVLWELIKKLKINVVTPIFTADDLLTSDYPYYLGRQGMPGNETANWAMDNCDLLLIIGERMQLTQTSFNYSGLAKNAYKIMVDIDPEEMRKKTLKIDLPVLSDAKVFLGELAGQKLELNRWDVEVKKIKPEQYQPEGNFVNVYKFMEELNQRLDGYHVATADGMCSLVTHQAIKLKKGQRLLTNAGLGQMGSGLPLAMGAAVSSGKGIACMEGDGSLMLNLQELQTVLYHRLPLKIFIWNNAGYFSIRTTHLTYFQKEFASSAKTGVSFPDFEKLVKAWGFLYYKITNDDELFKVKEVMAAKGPVVCELMIDPRQPLLPKWKAGQYDEKK